MTVVYKILDNGVVRDMTDAEKAEVDSIQKPTDWAARKLAEVRKSWSVSSTNSCGCSRIC